MVEGERESSDFRNEMAVAVLVMMEEGLKGSVEFGWESGGALGQEK
jgi:hypothetical protein